MFVLTAFFFFPLSSFSQTAGLQKYETLCSFGVSRKECTCREDFVRHVLSPEDFELVRKGGMKIPLAWGTDGKRIGQYYDLLHSFMFASRECRDADAVGMKDRLTRFYAGLLNKVVIEFSERYHHETIYLWATKGKEVWTTLSENHLSSYDVDIKPDPASSDYFFIHFKFPTDYCKGIYNAVKNQSAYEVTGPCQGGELVVRALYKGKNPTDVKISYYPGTTLKNQEITYLNGVKHGPTRSYTQTGILISELMYANGRAEGLARYYHANGTLREEAVFRNNARDGIAKTYDASGRLIEEAPYRNGKREGHVKTFNPDTGEVVTTVLFIDDFPDHPDRAFPRVDPDGVKRYYTRSGVLHAEEFYDDATRRKTHKLYYKGGQKLRALTTYVDGVMESDTLYTASGDVEWTSSGGQPTQQK